jgi:hypothetical protein
MNCADDLGRSLESGQLESACKRFDLRAVTGYQIHFYQYKMTHEEQLYTSVGDDR